MDGKTLEKTKIYFKTCIWIFLRFSILFVLFSNPSFSAEPVEMRKYLLELEKKEMPLQVFASNFLGDIEVQDAYTSQLGVRLEVIPAVGKEDVMALFELECLEQSCSMIGKFDFNFSIESLSFRIVPRLVLLSYSVEETNIPKLSLTKQFQNIIETQVIYEGLASWDSNPNRFWIVDDPNRLMQQRVTIKLDNFSKDQKIDLVKNCFKKCQNVRVVGNLMLELDRFLSIQAIKVTSNDNSQ